jgi:transposase
MIETKEVLGYFLPPGTLDYFNIKDFKIEEGEEKYMGLYGFDDHYSIILEEKQQLPQHPNIYQGQHLRTKGYSEKTIEDFPIRGRKTTLVFRRRKWQVEGEKGIIMRDIEISTEGVKYTKEFSFFFEENNRKHSL